MSKSKEKVSREIIEELIAEALRARKNAYAPYSNYKVGAAVWAKNNNVYSGANIENASFPAGICAERSAMVNAISDNNLEYKAIVIVGAHAELNEPTQFAYPCGVCRQFMAEFFDQNTAVIVAKSVTEYSVYEFEEILPFSFGKNNLEK